MVGQFSFQQWLDLCSSDSGQSSVGGGDEVALRLRKEARLHFEALPSSLRPSVAESVKISASQASPSKDSTVEQDLAKASSGTPNGALALLVSSLGPAFTPSSTIDRKVRALHCLMGALEGSADLTHGVRQAVGRFLVELCRPGCSEDRVDECNEDDIDQEMNYVDADNMTPEKLTEQLEAISAKRSKKSTISLTHDDVRDAAMIGLTALTRSHLEIFPTQQSQSSESKQSYCPATKALGVVHQSMEFRVELAILGVRYRCQMDSSNGSGGAKGTRGGSGAGYETVDPELNIDDGLSLLPRAKRSLCFNLFDAALDGLNDDELKCKKLLSQIQESSSTVDAMRLMIPSSVFIQMSAFASLTSSCMHGETDPRCLLQLLHLFNKMQRIMLPLFASNGNKSTKFPSIEIFDAVAPYYPLHFTPPKNDPHGITQGILQDALLAVLCERGANYDHKFLSKTNDQDVDGMKETMILLASRMFLERLEPPKTSDYDPPSNDSDSDVEDKLDAVQDLSSLFLPHFTPSKDGKIAITNGHDHDNNLPGRHVSLNVTRVPPEYFSELSLSMVRVHEEAVSSDAKALASAIRKFSSCLVKSLEPTSISSEVDTFILWEAYVVDVLRHLTPILGSAPQGMQGRASTAYFASLAAEGGPMTLNEMLDGCYPRFLGVLSSLDEKDSSREPTDVDESSPRLHSSMQKSRDEEKLAAAMRGIAALVSSCRVALQKWQRDNFGVPVDPHPLSLYAPSTLQKIAFVVNASIDEDKVGSLELAAVGALESVLTSYDLNLLEEGDMVSFEKSIPLMTRAVLVEERIADTDSTNLHEWNLACARVLGAVISVGMSQRKEGGGVVTNSCERMNTLATNLLPDMLASATSPHRGSLKLHTIRYDWVVLAGACANGTLHVSEQIISDLLSRIITTLRLNGENQKTSAMALSYIIRHGGPHVGTAFHGLSPPGPTQYDVIRELCHQENTVPRRKLQVGMSTLQLPVSRARDEEAANETIKRAQSILPFLIPAYECSSSLASCDSLARFVNKILPPLSECDEVGLYVSLPLLGAALKRPNKDPKKLECATSATLMSMVDDLALFSIRSDHHVHSRSAAASCLFSVLFQSSEDKECCACVIQKLIEEVVCPVLANALSCLEKEISESPTPRASGGVEVSSKSLSSVFSKVEDTLSFMSVLGSAAACKGGSFSQIGDKIALFLIELACTGASQYPFSEATAMQLGRPSQEGQKHPLLNPSSHAFILPASAFGSMLSVHNGGPFWRQRLTHKTLPILLGVLNAQAKSQNPPAMGTLCVVCHMLCCLPVSLLGEANMKQMIPTLVAGLVYFSKNSNAMLQSETITSKPTNLLPVIIAAVLKILAVSPEDVTKFIGIIIPSLLLLCSTAVEPAESCIPRFLLVFQCLETVAAHPHARNSILREKDQVIAVLSAVVDHPSSAIRNAVVQARNVWYTLA
ncbi:hypothetical protein ACHAW5_010905 [Stephanodiscus triporus]|uniref:MMS19 nucleotide excision repair protein n=1 Tax=Stephanodiscus triporus TaxID=2934178 RepID=A0ABD3NJM1_9STRA